MKWDHLDRSAEAGDGGESHEVDDGGPVLPELFVTRIPVVFLWPIVEPLAVDGGGLEVLHLPHLDRRIIQGRKTSYLT